MSCAGQLQKHFFVGLNPSCRTMVEKFKLASGDDVNWIEEQEVTLIHLQVDKIVLAASQVCMHDMTSYF